MEWVELTVWITDWNPVPFSCEGKVNEFIIVLCVMFTLRFIIAFQFYRLWEAAQVRKDLKTQG